MILVSKFSNYSCKIGGQRVAFYNHVAEVDDALATEVVACPRYGDSFWKQGEEESGAIPKDVRTIATRAQKQNIDDNFAIQSVLEPIEENTVEIVIVKYKLPEAEKKAIECVLENTLFPFKLTIIDNSDDHDTLSGIWNKMLKKTKCKYLCLLNNDAFVTKGWLTEMMRAFTLDDTACVGSSGDNVGGLQREMETHERSHGYRGKFKRLNEVSGYCWVVRTDLDIYFPEDVPFYGNDSAWCIDAERKGYNCIWAQGSFVYHLGSASGRKTGKNKKLREQGLRQFSRWCAKTMPILFLTYNRLDYTKKSLKALMSSGVENIYIIDNNSTDGTREWLQKKKSKKINRIILNDENLGVAGAMGQFFEITKDEPIVAKVDNDTIVPKDWLTELVIASRLRQIDVVQARHHILHGKYETFDEWKRSELIQDRSYDHIYFAPFVGGSAICVRRWNIKDEVCQTTGVLAGWTEYQTQRPHLTKAFHDGVFIELLDMEADNKQRYSDYEDYYVEVGRKKDTNTFIGTEKTFNTILDKIGERFAFLRFGDGELLLMEGDEGRKHLQWNSPRFQEEMREAFSVDDRNYFIAVSAGMQNEEHMEHGLFARFDNDAELKKIVAKYHSGKQFYNPIVFHYYYTFFKNKLNKLSEALRGKNVVFVGGQHLHDSRVMSFFNASIFVRTPETQAYDHIDEWYPLVKDSAKNADVVIFAVGPVSNIAQKRLWDEGITVGSIDIGSMVSAMVDYEHDKHNWIKIAKERGLI